jgi:acetoin utilization deacetylase AcuC-like enzyme
MRPVKLLGLSYCDHYDFPLPEAHKFPLAKYRLLRERLADSERFGLEPAELATRNDIVAVHAQEYTDAFLAGTLDWASMRRIGFPWSPELVSRTLASVGSTLMAVKSALRSGFGGTLAGGTHHAFRDAGAGFCVFNDLAVAIAYAQRQAHIRRAAVLDLDVHPGDGTAALFERNADIFTLSVHGERNFPFRKQRSSLDIELPDGTEDEGYLRRLEPALDQLWNFDPQLIVYQAGVDSLSSDRLGRLSLSLAGLKQRDELVMQGAKRCGIPLAITIGGGYSEPIGRTVDAHAQSFEVAAGLFAS